MKKYIVQEKEQGMVRDAWSDYSEEYEYDDVHTAISAAQILTKEHFGRSRKYCFRVISRTEEVVKTIRRYKKGTTNDYR